MAGRVHTLKRAMALGATVGFVAALVAVLVVRGREASPDAWPVPGEGDVVAEVEVLNGAGVDGLARAVTARLRRVGIDVVFFGTAGQGADATLIVVRRGDSTVAVPIRAALGLGRIVVDLDPDRLLDVSVVLGVDAAALGRDP